MTPIHPADRSNPEKPDVLDAVIRKIDASLPAIHRMCKVKQKRASTLPKVRARFQELVDDPILNDAGTDIVVPQTKINGFLPDAPTAESA